VKLSAISKYKASKPTRVSVGEKNNHETSRHLAKKKARFLLS